MLVVKIHKNALKDLDLVPIGIKENILETCRAMRTDPFVGDVVPIKGMPGVFRKRIGVYRIAFSVDFKQNEVLIIKIGKRDKFYDDL